MCGSASSADGNALSVDADPRRDRAAAGEGAGGGRRRCVEWGDGASLLPFRWTDSRVVMSHQLRWRPRACASWAKNGFWSLPDLNLAHRWFYGANLLLGKCIGSLVVPPFILRRSPPLPFLCLTTTANPFVVAYGYRRKTYRYSADVTELSAEADLEALVGTSRRQPPIHEGQRDEDLAARGRLARRWHMPV